MSTLPGSIGYTLFGDKSVEFYRDPKQFIFKRIEESGSRIFQSRLLNAPTAFVCSTRETHELLYEKSCDFDHGYHDFLFNSFGDNILFRNGEEASYLKLCMEPLFSQPKYFEPLIERVSQRFLNSISERNNPINVYEDFKALMTRLCLELFLGFSDNSSEEASLAISKLTTMHWHGIISMPINVKIPFAGESGWRKALQAKEDLLIHIRSTMKRRELNSISKVESRQNPISSSQPQTDISDSRKEINMIDHLSMAPFRNPSTEIEQHILLFISALIPKAFASIITSFILEMAGDDMAVLRERANSDPEFHKRTLLEVQRLWPPFFGGRRIANKDTTIGKYKIPKGYAVVYATYFAHRDGNHFTEPDAFSPDRWLINRHSDSLFTFGGGPRCCLGTQLIQYILLYLTKRLLENYSWSTTTRENKPCTYKLLPVTRPDPVPYVNFIKK